ncbi:MAG: hypothetical protein ACJ8AT_30560 [Hyalangium sp.]|uniref:hypothetical protein n=1 Tax=Hyalangium sp. TaxID=2028555 RepID=UPI0038998832
MECPFCQQGECINPAHAVAAPPDRDAGGRPFAPLDGNALQKWQSLLDRIRLRRLKFPAGLHRIEVTTGTQDVTTATRKMFVFEHARQWRGYSQDQYG